MCEPQQLTWLPPDKCTSREWEISRSKTSKQISIDSDRLTIKEKQDLPDQTGKMQVFEAMRRRGIALDFANLLTWQVHERYLVILFGHLRKDPVEGTAKCRCSKCSEPTGTPGLASSNQALLRRTAAGALPSLGAKERAKVIKVGQKCCPKHFVVVIAAVLTHTTDGCV